MGIHDASLTIVEAIRSDISRIDITEAAGHFSKDLTAFKAGVGDKDFDNTLFDLTDSISVDTNILIRAGSPGTASLVSFEQNFSQEIHVAVVPEPSSLTLSIFGAL